MRGSSINEEVVRLRDQILAAEASGAEKAGMLLQLTARMDSAIKRSALVPAEDVKFSDGQMRYLGVLVQVGEVSVSGLSLTGGAPVKGS